MFFAFVVRTETTHAHNEIKCSFSLCVALQRVYRLSSSALGSQAHRDRKIVWEDSRARA